MEYLRTYEMLRKVGAFAVETNREYDIVTDDLGEEADKAADYVIGSGPVDGDDYFESILTAFAPYIGADDAFDEEEDCGCSDEEPSQNEDIYLGDDLTEEAPVEMLLGDDISGDDEETVLGDDMDDISYDSEEEPAVDPKVLEKIMGRGEMDSIDDSIEDTIVSTTNIDNEVDSLVALGEDTEDSIDDGVKKSKYRKRKPMKTSTPSYESDEEEQDTFELEGNFRMKQMVREVEAMGADEDNIETLTSFAEINDIVERYRKL